MAELVTLRPSELTAVLEGEGGPVYADLTRRVLNVHAAATRLCPVDTGRLRSSLRWSVGRDSQGLVGLVGSDVEYAGFVNDGTRFMAAQPFLTDALSEALT